MFAELLISYLDQQWRSIRLFIQMKAALPRLKILYVKAYGSEVVDIPRTRGGQMTVEYTGKDTCTIDPLITNSPLISDNNANRVWFQP